MTEISCLDKFLNWYPNSEKCLGAEKVILVHTSFRFYTPGILSNNYGSASVLLHFSHTQTYLICLVYLKQKAWEFSKPSDLRSPSAPKCSLQKKKKQ